MACGQADYDQKLQSLYSHTVPVIQPKALKEKLENQETVLLLDTRSFEEFEVSHLPGAEFVDYETFEIEAYQDLPREQPVVVYCSVGYRSEKIGEQLKKIGFQNVFNLYGGIFQWKNTGFQVVDPAGKETEKVHTYNRQWGQWLKEGIKIY
jgi:rhodanese-related sulfurtransferase